MARIEHIKRRLDNWALWRGRRDNHGLGYPSRNMLANWMASVGSDTKQRESVVPVLHLEAEETERAVQLMKLGKGHLFKTLEYIYLRDRGVQETARLMGRSPSTIHAQLQQADAWIAAWLEEQGRQREEQQARARGRAFMER